jgi:hypothetical protein
MRAFNDPPAPERPDDIFLALSMFDNWSRDEVGGAAGDECILMWSRNRFSKA